MTRLGSVGLTACLLSGAWLTSGAQQAGPTPSSPRTTMEAASTSTTSTTMRTLIVSRPKEGRIGTLTFESGNRVTLVTEGSGPAVDELQKAWSEMSAMPKLKWVRSEVKEIDGRKVTQIRAREYAREESAYFYAVLDTLSRRYGFRVDIGK